MRHVRREAWEQENASGLPESVKDVTRMDLLATPPNLDAFVRGALRLACELALPARAARSKRASVHSRRSVSPPPRLSAGLLCCHGEHRAIHDQWYF